MLFAVKSTRIPDQPRRSPRCWQRFASGNGRSTGTVLPPQEGGFSGKNRSLLRGVLTAGLIGTLMTVSLLLGGCFGSGVSGKLKLGQATVSPPVVANEGVLRVGVDSSRAPYAGLSDGKVIGIDVDIAAAMSDQMGLKLEVIDTKDQDPSTLLANGTIDVVMGLQSDDLTNFTGAPVGPYLVDGPAIFTLGQSDTPPAFDPTQLNGQQIAVQEGSLSAWRIGKDYGADSVASYPTLESAFNQLTGGTYTYVAADAIVGSFVAVKEGNVQCLGIINDIQGVYMGVASDNNDLVSALTKTMRDIKNDGSLQIIVAKWLGPTSASVVSSDQALSSVSSTDATTTTDTTTDTTASGDTSADTTASTDTTTDTSADTTTDTTGDTTGDQTATDATAD